MQTMLIKERYKVVRALEVQENYAFLETVDIKDREKTTCLLNLYEAELLPVYLDVYDRLEACPAYRGAFIADGSLVSLSYSRNSIFNHILVCIFSLTDSEIITEVVAS